MMNPFSSIEGGTS